MVAENSEMRDKQPTGKAFLELSAISVYGVWLMVFLFPLVLVGVSSLIDGRRSPKSLMLSSIALGVIAVSYIFRFYLVRNKKSLRSKVLKSDHLEQTLIIISGGFWWGLITLVCAMAAVISSRSFL